MVKYPEYTVGSPEAREIIKILREVADWGHVHRDRVFSDWLEVVVACLDALPRHLEQAAADGTLAEDTPEVQALWERLRATYVDDHHNFMNNFARAFGVLLSSTDVFQDALGEIYMAFGWPSKGMGQYFTPWDVCRMMVDMLEPEDRENGPRASQSGDCSLSSGNGGSAGRRPDPGPPRGPGLVFQPGATAGPGALRAGDDL